MLAVTCFQCGHAVEINPDADRCGVCGSNLRRLISAQQASRYFYMRAAEMSSKGDVAAALNEVQRGLAYQPSSELHLLGAILCKRQGKLDAMRHHVAAIPVDDVLRGEAEWLLRSSNARQRTPADARRAQEEAPLPDDELLPVVMEEVRPSPNRGRRTSPLGLLLGVVLMALLLFAGWWFWPELSDWMAAVLPAEPVAAPVAEPPASEPNAGAAPAAEQAAPTQAAAEPLATIPAPVQEAPTATPTGAVAPDLARAASEPVAAASPDAVVQSPPFDLKTVLIEAQRPELAETVNGRLEGTRLVLEGTVPSVETRNDLIALMERLPGVEEVSAVNVLVRPPSTYTVKEGDSLWNISMELYGSPDYIQALFDANSDALPSADALRVGMVLTVPPVD